jgi:hypothetical protein
MTVKTIICWNGDSILYDADIHTAEFTEYGWILKLNTGQTIWDEVSHTSASSDDVKLYYQDNPPPPVPILSKPKKVYTELSKISDIYKYPNLSKYSGLTGKIPVRAGTTYIGVEVELEKVVAKHNQCGTWQFHEDGSLKDNGAEFVTIPIQFQYLEVELDRLFGSLKSCNTSSRCSIHVHLNVRDFTLLELKTFLALYLVFEKSLYNYSGDRWNNNFCVPLNFYPNIVRDFIQYINENNKIYEKWYKYFGLNLSPVFGGESKKIGTIEFRHMKGTVDKEWIINWINLIVSLKIAAKNIPFDDVMNHIATMNTTSGYYWLAREVFKDYTGFICGQDSFKKDVESCITKAKYILCNPIKAIEEIAVLDNEKGVFVCVGV